MIFSDLLFVLNLLCLIYIKETNMIYLLSSIIFLLLLFPSCSDINDCACTMEFRMITVLVVDEMNDPVSGLNTTVKDESGRTFGFLHDPFFFPGYYTVMDDNYTREFSPIPKLILFTGIKDSQSVSADFFINTDDCHCHIEKVSGPDTLVLR